jgi:hypothetical protein
MNKAILVGVAILTVSTPAASAFTHRIHHSRAKNPNAAAAMMHPNRYAGPRNAYAAMGAPPAAMPGVSSKNHEMRMKNLRASGYNPKNDFDKAGNVAQH